MKLREGRQRRNLLIHIFGADRGHVARLTIRVLQWGNTQNLCPILPPLCFLWLPRREGTYGNMLSIKPKHFLLGLKILTVTSKWHASFLFSVGEDS